MSSLYDKYRSVKVEFSNEKNTIEMEFITQKFVGYSVNIGYKKIIKKGIWSKISGYQKNIIEIVGS